MVIREFCGFPSVNVGQKMLVPESFVTFLAAKKNPDKGLHDPQFFSTVTLLHNGLQK